MLTPKFRRVIGMNSWDRSRPKEPRQLTPVVIAEVGTRRVTWTPTEGWRCTCGASSTCPHIIATARCLDETGLPIHERKNS